MRNLAREQLLAELRALRPALEEEGVRSMMIFGSRARGDHRPDSDIDLLVEVDEKAKFSLLDLVGVGQIIEEEVGLPANIFLRRSLDHSFLRSAARDELSVF